MIISSEQVFWIKAMERPLLHQRDYEPIVLHRSEGLGFQLSEQVIKMESNHLSKQSANRGEFGACLCVYMNCSALWSVCKGSFDHRLRSSATTMRSETLDSTVWTVFRSPMLRNTASKVALLRKSWMQWQERDYPSNVFLKGFLIGQLCATTSALYT